IPPLPSPPPPAVPPSPEHIDQVGDDIETLCASLTSAMQEMMTLRARVGLLEQHDVVTRDSLEILELRSRAEYAESRLEQSHDRQTGDGVRTKRAVMTEQEVEALRARAEAAEQ
ncbi:hypothetical protein Tco_0426994, partial [Tanacetum coccineum]